MAYSPTDRTTEFFLHISRLPQGYTWQDLKDIVRRVASHGIWTDVRETEGTRHGGVKVTLQDEAVKLYTYLRTYGIEHRPVHVAFWDTSRPPARFIECNEAHNHALDTEQISGFLGSPSWMQPPSPASSMSSAYDMYSTPRYSNPAMMPMNGLVYPPLQATAQVHRYYAPTPDESLQYTYAQQCAPLQRTNAYIPVNDSEGVFPTAAPRGVLVTNLHYSVNEASIRNRFSTVGPVISCRLGTNRSTGRSNGSAQVKYRSFSEAVRACQVLHGSDMGARVIGVRLLREEDRVPSPNASAAPSREPLVADGSQTQRHRGGASRTSRV